MAHVLLELRGGKQTLVNGRRRGETIVGYAKVLDDEFSREVLAKVAWHVSTKK